MDKKFSLLCIGNSFADDMIYYLYPIAESLGYEIKVESLYIGGCPLSKHLQNINENANAYELRVWNKDKKDWDIVLEQNIKDNVTKYDWDFISMQQASYASGKKESFACLDELFAKVKAMVVNPKHTKFVWHLTWANDTNFEALIANYNNDQMFMYNSIIDNVKSIIVPSKYYTTIIPNGTAIQNGRTIKGTSWSRDGLHLDMGKARYMASMLCFCKLTGLCPKDIKYYPDCMSKEEKEMVDKVATAALEKPFEVTKI